MNQKNNVLQTALEREIRNFLQSSGHELCFGGWGKRKGEKLYCCALSAFFYQIEKIEPHKHSVFGMIDLSSRLKNILNLEFAQEEIFALIDGFDLEHNSEVKDKFPEMFALGEAIHRTFSPVNINKV